MTKTFKCRQCQMPNLIWRNTRKGWRLAEGFGGKVHSCATFENNANKPVMGKPPPQSTVSGTMYDEHMSRMNQDEDERLLIMVLGDYYENI